MKLRDANIPHKLVEPYSVTKYVSSKSNHTPDVIIVNENEIEDQKKSNL